jgi:chitin synthase
MVWYEMAGLVARADASIPDFTDPWAVKDVSDNTRFHSCVD